MTSTCRVDLVLLDLRAAPRLEDLRLGVLAADERERLAAYRVPRAARTFAVGRLALRRVLADHDGPGTDPAAPRLDSDDLGKPRRVDGTGPWFNVSHAGDRLVIACCETHDVGVDVERIESLHGRRTLWTSTCAPNERMALAGLSEALADATFGRIWTRKEALVKAMGAGLRTDFTLIDLSSVLEQEAGDIVLPGPRDGIARRLLWRDARGAGDGPAAVAVVAARLDAMGTGPGTSGPLGPDDIEVEVRAFDLSRLP